jgi:hypothetical protein
MYTIPSHSIAGRLLTNSKGQVGLLWLPDAPEVSLVHLRYALVEMGTERPFWPSFILDDWGRKISGLEMYRWLHEEGERFPRAEIFGYDANWVEEQGFVRAMELHFRHPCWAYPTAETPLAEGVRLRHVLVVEEGMVGAELLAKPPAGVPEPLGRTQLKWWRVGEETADWGA